MNLQNMLLNEMLADTDMKFYVYYSVFTGIITNLNREDSYKLNPFTVMQYHIDPKYSDIPKQLGQTQI